MDPENFKAEYDKMPDELAAERARRLQDANAMRQPDRVPVSLNLGYMLARLGAISFTEMDNNPRLTQQLLEKWALYNQPDEISGGGCPASPAGSWMINKPAGRVMDWQTIVHSNL